MSSTFSAAEEEKKPRRLLGAKSLVVSGLAVAGASQSQPANAQYTVNTVSGGSQTLGAGSLNITSIGGSSGPTALNSLTKINVAAADLIGVTFSYSGGISQSATFTVPNSTSALTGTLSFNDTLVLSSNSGLFTTGATVSSYNVVGGPYAHGNNVSGTTASDSPTNSGTSPPNSSGNNGVSGSIVNVQNPGLGGFVGSGTLGFTLKLTDASNFQGSGGVTAFDAQNTSSTVSVTYTYLTGSDAGGLLTNGSFSLPAEIQGPTSNGNLPGGGFIYGTASAATGLTASYSSLNVVPGIGWTFGSSAILQKNGSAWGFSNSPDGDQTVALQGGSNATITQSFTAATKGFYKLTFYAETRPGGSGTGVEVTINGTVLNATANGYNNTGTDPSGFNASTGAIEPPSTSSWTLYTLYTQQLPIGSDSIQFVGLGGSEGIASVHLQYGYSSVPAPDSLLVFAGSALPLYFMRRRRAKASLRRSDGDANSFAA